MMQAGMWKIEDDQFWPAEKTRFWVYVSITIIAAAVVVFAIYAWVLYQQKIQQSEMDSTPRAVPPGNTDVSTNVAQSSLSPATNSN